MAKASATRTIDAPISKVWASWDNFGDIYVFNPNIVKSHLLNNKISTGIGATRQCDFTDGKNHIKERIIGYVPEQSMTIDIYDGTVPLKRAVATITFVEVGLRRTEIKMEMDFIPKLGFLGKLMIPMMQKQFTKAITGLLAGNAAHVEKNSHLNAA